MFLINNQNQDNKWVRMVIVLATLVSVVPHIKYHTSLKKKKN